MGRRNKSTYLIIALTCLILLNLGSMLIVFTKNIDNFKGGEVRLLGKLKKALRVDNIVQEVMKFPFPKKDDKKDPSDNENELEIYDDFIITDALEEYENLIIVKDSSGKDSIENIPEPLNIKKIEVDKDKPYIYIYHTHATETFSPYKDNNYHTTDNKKNMVNIGEILTKVLEAGGHKVIHEKTHHDIPSYNQSYSRSLNSLERVMKKEKNLKIFLDLHRDGIEMDKPNYKKRLATFKTEIEGKPTATFSLVVGPHSPNYEQVLNFAKYIKAVSDVMYPDLCTGIIVKKVGKFNQFVSDYAALLEIGSNGNTLEEVEECIKLVGDVLDVA
ncbi:MAG TPA: stage II sporulation protein P, partial [Tissierellaceae bacterium]|nr:stage II sporulation protein P [Tissierellaceae bacterium]